MLVAPTIVAPLPDVGKLATREALVTAVVEAQTPAAQIPEAQIPAGAGLVGEPAMTAVVLWRQSCGTI